MSENVLPKPNEVVLFGLPGHLETDVVNAVCKSNSADLPTGSISGRLRENIANMSTCPKDQFSEEMNDYHAYQSTTEQTSVSCIRSKARELTLPIPRTAISISASSSSFASNSFSVDKRPSANLCARSCTASHLVQSRTKDE